MSHIRIKRPPEKKCHQVTNIGEHIDADVPIKIVTGNSCGPTVPSDAAEPPEDADMGSRSAAKND